MNETRSKIYRWWDLPAAALLLAALITSAARLSVTHWTDHLAMVQTVVIFGAIAGLALGKSRFSSRAAFILSSIYGAFVVPWQLGITLITQRLEWTERLSILTNRLSVIIYQLVNQESVHDSLLFLVLMAILFWILGVYAGYSLVRDGNAWKTSIPGGLALFIIHTFDPLLTRRAIYLAVYLFFTLVLVARINYLQRHKSWQRSRTALPPHLGLDFIRFALFAALLIVFFAWTVPALANALPAAQKAWQPIQRVWNETKDNFENAFASLRPSAILVERFYGNSAILGAGNPLSDAMMFTVQPPENLPSSLRLYWRARTYDTYTNGQWLSESSEAHNFNPEQDELRLPTHVGRWSGTFEIIGLSNVATLFTPAQPIWVNRPGQVEYALNPDDTIDVSTFRAIPGLVPGQSYQTQASLNNATIAQLKSAGEEYPEWISERYLQLPESITERTRLLAAEITAASETPYEKAWAVTNYLRANITYVDRLPESMPTNQDIIDWFLFDLRQGFCNYYSTAEVVLLRSIGIPARWAVGYAQGEKLLSPDEEISYVVRQKNAHAWPEVYFPGIGWVEFEPTVSEPVINRLPGQLEDANNLNPNVPDIDESQRLLDEFEAEMELLRQERNQAEAAGSQQTQSTVVYWIVGLLLPAAVLLFLAWRFLPVINLVATPIYMETALIKMGIAPPKPLRLWARRAELPPLSRAYLEINRALSRLARKPAVNETPTERAERLGIILPSAQEPAHNLVNEYQVATFSTQPADQARAVQASKEIRNLSIKAYLRRLFARLQQR